MFRYLNLFSSLSLAVIIFTNCSEKPQLKELDSFIQFKMERDNIPGLQLLITNSNEVLFSKGYGSARIENDIPMSTFSAFCVASIAKSITAFAIMQLNDSGKLNINDPFDKYIPFKVRNPFHPNTEITIAQVLSHTSSISNGSYLWRNFSDGDPTISLTDWAYGYFNPEGIFYHKEGNFERWKPGEGFLYSNGG